MQSASKALRSLVLTYRIYSADLDYTYGRRKKEKEGQLFERVGRGAKDDLECSMAAAFWECSDARLAARGNGFAGVDEIYRRRGIYKAPLRAAQMDRSCDRRIDAYPGCYFVCSVADLGVAAQRAITNMRKRVQSHIERLPISYFDSTQSGQLISRIMNDAEGIRNLVGTGLGQILGSLVTATIAIGVLFYINWQLTTATLVVLLIFGGALMYAFKVLRPVFRERNVITAEVTGRLGESLGGIRIVKAYTAEKREELSFARGAHKLFRNVAKTVTGVSAISSFSSVIIGAIAVVMIVIGGNAVQANTMTLGDFLMYISFTFLLAMPVIELTSIGTQITEALAGLDRIREIMSMTTEDDADADKEALPRLKERSILRMFISNMTKACRS